VTKTASLRETNAVDVPVASAMVALGIAVAADPHRSVA
jgi:hypothetical protein